MYSDNLKKGCAKRIHPSKFCDSFVSKSKKRSAINIRRSMLDVRCWTFDVQSVSCSSQAEFHTSTAVGLISGQSNYQQTVPFWCGFIREVVGSHRKSESQQEIRNLLSTVEFKLTFAQYVVQM